MLNKNLTTGSRICICLQLVLTVFVVICLSPKVTASACSPESTLEPGVVPRTVLSLRAVGSAGSTPVPFFPFFHKTVVGVLLVGVVRSLHASKGK